MKKLLVRALCLMAVLVLAIASVTTVASADDRAYKYVKTANGKSLNVRANPWKEQGNIVATVPYRAYVLVYQYSDNRTWAYIEAEHGVKGWVATSFLVNKDPGPYKPVNPDEPDTSVSALNKVAKAIKVLDNPYVTVIQTKKATNYVHLRWFPDTNAVYSGAYLRNTEIEVLATSKTWAQVRIVEDGKVGFILMSTVAPVAE